MGMVDRVFVEAVNDISAARTALGKLEKVTCRIAAQRKTVSTGQACMGLVAEARHLLQLARDHLALYEARLQQLAEGVSRHVAG